MNTNGHEYKNIRKEGRRMNYLIYGNAGFADYVDGEAGCSPSRIREKRPDIVVCFADDDSEAYLERNLLDTHKLLDACVDVGTSFVLVYTADDSGTPQAASKKGAELLALSYKEKYGLPVRVSRSTEYETVRSVIPTAADKPTPPPCQPASLRIGVIGFGYIGTVIGAVLAERGFRVAGVDPSPRVAEAINSGHSPFNEPGLDELVAKNTANGRLSVSSDPATTKGCVVYVVTVGTPLSEDFTADMSQIQAAVRGILPYLEDGALLILKSTVPPFTTSGYVAPLVKETGKKIKLAFCPERLAEGKAISEFTSIPVVVGGIDAESTEAAAEFWHNTLGADVIKVGSSTAAEMVKLTDNLWIDLNIALAGELAMLSDKMGIDVLEVITAANSLPKGYSYVNVLTPSVGVGGYCLTKDPWFVQHLGKQNGIELLLPKSGRAINDAMPLYSAERIDNILQLKGKQRNEQKIAVVGIAFKNNTGDCRYTPTKPCIDKLIDLGYNVEICDPWTDEHGNAMVTDLPVGKDPLRAIEHADCVAFLAGHDDFHKIPIKTIAELANPNALIFDGRMFFSREKIAEMSKYNLLYKGVGR
jgi:UDP-N-acetyl-D-mannosaminuronic acid dehydrogenase